MGERSGASGIKCLYALVLKTRRNDRVVKVDRPEEIGSKADSEDSLL
jgi:hypothetical protein